MVSRIEISKERIKEFCRQNHIKSMALFGSALREDFKPDSDVDVMVEFEQAYRPGLMELVENAGTNDSARPVPPDYSRPRPDVPMKSEQEARPMKCPDEIIVMFV